ncbi:MAG: tyrosine-protein phosphatase [Clostridia bacterium]|nr:tyrosine-protein phosphatase [Clostridia bacterium]
MTSPVSRLLPFDALPNTRDLGGIPAAGGTIKPGRLFRSGALASATPRDVKTLTASLSAIIDLRAEGERAGRPDPVLPDVDVVWLPVVDEPTTGLTRDEESMNAALAALSHDPDAATWYMHRTYRNFVAGPRCRAQFSAFVRELLRPREGAVLWHCSAGKDRAGFGAVILLALLGVARDTIERDYLFTNDCLRGEMDTLVRAREQAGKPDEAAAVRRMFGAHADYLAQSFLAADELYGGFDGYLRDGLGVTDEMREKLIAQYVTP